MKTATKPRNVLALGLASAFALAACGSGSSGDTAADTGSAAGTGSADAPATASADTMSADTMSADTMSADTMSSESKTAEATAGGGGGGGDYVIGVSNTLAGNGWREEMICSVKAQSLASGEVSKVISISKNGGPTEQIQDLQNLISQGVNAIIVNPSDREKLNPVIEEAAKQGIVVVSVDQAVTAESAYVATNDQVAYGRLGMQWLVDDLGGKGNVLYMRGIDGVPADADRNEGVQEVLAANPDITVKEVFTGWDFTKGADIAVQELTAADYDGIWTSGIDYTVVNAFATVGKDPVPVVGADTNGFFEQLIAGQPGAAVSNPAVIGGVGTTIALKALNGETVDRETLLTPQVWDMANNAAEIEANYFPDRDKNYSAAVSIEGYTTYTPEQLFACKGPGE